MPFQKFMQIHEREMYLNICTILSLPLNSFNLFQRTYNSFLYFISFHPLTKSFSQNSYSKDMKKCQRHQNNFCMSLKINYIFESCSKKTVFCSRKIVKIVHEIEVKHKDEIYFFLSPRNVLYALLI